MKTVENRIDSNMTPFPTMTSSETPVSEALDFMEEMEIRHLPIVQNGKVIGIVSARDLGQAQLLAKAKITVAEVMTPNPYCVAVGTPLSVVTKEMAQHKYGSAIVTNESGEVVGIFTTTDAMRLLSEILSSHRGADLKTWAVERLMDAQPFLQPISDLGI